MSQNNNFFWKMHRGELPQPKIAETLGMEFTDIDTDAGTLTATFHIGEAFTNPMGNVQGGILSAMLDDTLGPCLVATLDDNQFAPTLNLNVSFIKAGKAGAFTGRARIVKRGRSIGYMSGELYDAEDNLIATATATAKISSI